eukprot:Gb_28407 [translate_table: standard]
MSMSMDDPLVVLNLDVSPAMDSKVESLEDVEASKNLKNTRGLCWLWLSELKKRLLLSFTNTSIEPPVKSCLGLVRCVEDDALLSPLPNGHMYFSCCVDPLVDTFTLAADSFIPPTNQDIWCSFAWDGR